MAKKRAVTMISLSLVMGVGAAWIANDWVTAQMAAGRGEGHATSWPRPWRFRSARKSRSGT